MGWLIGYDPRLPKYAVHTRQKQNTERWEGGARLRGGNIQSQNLIEYKQSGQVPTWVYWCCWKPLRWHESDGAGGWPWAWSLTSLDTHYVHMGMLYVPGAGCRLDHWSGAYQYNHKSTSWVYEMLTPFPYLDDEEQISRRMIAILECQRGEPWFSQGL